MELKHEWLLIASVVFPFAVIGMKLVKHKWLAALKFGSLATVVLVPMFTILHYLSIQIGQLGSALLFAGKLPNQMVADFGISGAIALTAGLYVFYCLASRKKQGYPGFIS